MKIVYLSYFFDRDLETAEQLLDRYYTMTHFCPAVRKAGTESVTVVQRFKRSEEIERDGVQYIFVRDGRHQQPRFWELPNKVHTRIIALRPDIVHHNGWPYPLVRLRRILPAETAIVWQHHGGGIPGIRSGWFFRRGLRAVDGFFFTSSEISDAWEQRSLIAGDRPVFEILEGSSVMKPLPYYEMKVKHRLEGSPTFLWVGHLNSNKDPLAVLEGFSLVTGDLPNAHLYLAYGTGDLEPKLRSLISSRHLIDRVHMLGRLTQSTLQELYSGSDYFLLGSHTEGSGFALLEALSCGVTPIVTNIPSFRKITGNGEIGALWKPGDVLSLASTILRVVHQPSDRNAIRSYFDRRLSFDAIALYVLPAYEAIWRQRNGKV